MTTPSLSPATGGGSLTERVDLRTGHIRASGHLTPQGADLLCGTADSLRGSGHTRVVLDLQDVRAADVAGLDILRTLRTTFAAAGGELLIRHEPEPTSEVVGGWDEEFTAVLTAESR